MRQIFARQRRDRISEVHFPVKRGKPPKNQAFYLKPRPESSFECLDQEQQQKLRNLSECQGQNAALIVLHVSNIRSTAARDELRLRGDGRLPIWHVQICTLVCNRTCIALQSFRARHTVQGYPAHKKHPPTGRLYLGSNGGPGVGGDFL